MGLQIDTINNGAELTKKMLRYRLWIFLAISATYLLSYFHRAAPAVVGPEIMKEFAMAPTTLGFIDWDYIYVEYHVLCYETRCTVYPGTWN